MKKQIVFVLAVMGVVVMFSGCGRKVQQLPTRPALRFVVGVEVTYREGDTALRWQYTSHEKVEAVLLYLRTLSPLGQVKVDPQRVEGEHYEIILQYSDNSHIYYYQHTDKYLSKDFKPFEQIDPKQGRKLWLLLEQMPSDIL